MPIYAYKCSSCGVSKDILRKISDPVLTLCPACGSESLAKQVTAAGFQLKGSGWYVTDFRGGDAKDGKDGKTAPQATPDKASTSADSAATPSVAASPAPAAATTSAPATAPISTSGASI